MTNYMRGSVLALALTMVGCGSPPSTLTGPDEGSLSVHHPGALFSRGGGGQGSDSITLVEAAPGAPAISQDPVSFYAVQGKERSAEVWYHAEGGTTDSMRFLRFRVRKKAQIVLPNGTRLARGDSVLITIQVTDPNHLITDFQPSGLRFIGREAADLTMWYLETSHDFNHDGVIDTADAAIEETLSIFRQEYPGAPWEKVSSIVTSLEDEIETTIAGFTNYVIAY